MKLTLDGRQAVIVPASASTRSLRTEAVLAREQRFVSAWKNWRWAFTPFLLLALPGFSQSGNDFKNPETVWYDGGNVNITASKQPVEWDGHPEVRTNVYSVSYKKEYAPSYTPPTIHVNPGTTLNIKLVSKIDYTGALPPCDNTHHQYTNLHYHGFEVSPKAPQDDVVSIKVTNEPYQYAVVLPHGHPEGMFWYHPHPHGCSNFQVNGGLSGILIVGDILKHQYPALAGITERILLLKDGDPRPQGAAEQARSVLRFSEHPAQAEPDPITVNGMSQPAIPIKTGEKQFFRIGNVGTNSFVQVAFDPPVNATIIAVDGMATDRGLSLPDGGWLLPPGSRVEMIVEGPKEGTYKIVSKEIPYARSPEGGTVLATLKAEAPRSLKAGAASRKAQAQAPRARSAYYPRNEEFQAPPVADGCDVHSKPPDTPKTKGCTFVFSDKDGDYMINDKVYNESVTDVTCKIRKDKVYDWTLCNDTDEHHAFHIHQIHFEVVDVDGHPLDAPVRDVVDLPQRPDDDHVSRVRIKMSFQHDYLAGKFVFHCHMLEHEDKGMMMNIDLVP